MTEEEYLFCRGLSNLRRAERMLCEAVDVYVSIGDTDNQTEMAARLADFREASLEFLAFSEGLKL